MLFSAMQNQEKVDYINKLLEQKPELVAKLEEFKKANPNGFDASVRNFDTNTVSLGLLEKLASGKILTWYDWM